MLLFDDEEFTPRDSEARKLVYGRVHPENPPLLSLSGSEVKHISCLNLTSAHFVEGATRFSDLKPEAFRLFCSWMNALGHATDKKKNPRPKPTELSASSGIALNSSTAALQKEKPRKKKKSNKRRKRTKESELQEAASEESTDDAQDDSTTSDTDANERMNGDEHCSLYVETLFDTQNQVAGYRLWAFDTSVHKTRIDLFTRAMRESLVECQLLQKQIQTKMEQFQRSQSNSGQAKRAATQKSCEVAARYKFTQYDSEELYLSLIKGYFLGDTLMSTTTTNRPSLATLLDNEDDEVQEEVECKPGFTDSRPFMSQQHQSLRTSGTANSRPKFEMPLFFSKEQAMVYHVEASQIQLEQRTLQCYFSPHSQRVVNELKDRAALEHEGGQKANRLEQMLKEKVEEKSFHHFPFANTTYRVDCTSLSLELMSEMPLPHRMGSFLYTEAQRHEAMKQVQSLRQLPEPSPLEERVARRPLGLHDMELEVTPGLLHSHQDQLGEEMRRHLIAKQIPRQLAQAFLGQTRNAVQREMHTVNSLLKQPKNDLVEQRVGGQLVMNKSHQQLFHANTQAGLVNNRFKTALLERRVGQEVGGLSSDAREKERAAMLARGNMTYMRPILGKWRETHATLANAKRKCIPLLHDETFMARDYGLVLHSFNAVGHQAILEKYTDPENGQIRPGQWDAYQRDKREFMEAAMVELWEEFFTSPNTSFAGKGIREDLKQAGRGKGHIGHQMPLYYGDLQARPYHQYKIQLYKYFSDHGGLNHHYKTMYGLWHAASHHCRFYQPGCKDPKLAWICAGNGDVGKSHRLNLVKESCPTGVCEGLTYMTEKAMLTDMNWNDILIINEEMSNKIVGPEDVKGDAQFDDSRNHTKERMTGHQTTTLAFYFDDETGDRKARLSKCQCQCNILGATNVDLSRMDPNIASRFIFSSIPSSMDENEGNRAQDKEKQSSGRDPRISAELIEQQKQVRRLVYLMEQAVKSGVFGDAVFGCEVDGARILINKILDRMQSQYRIPTNKPRKRKHVLEMARILCIQSWCWYVSTSPELRELQYDPQTGVYLGVNPRMLMAIADRLVVTTDHVIDALTILSCLWTPDYLDTILWNFAFEQCKLDELRLQDFVHRPPPHGAQRDALETAPLTYSRKGRGRSHQMPAWSLGHSPQQQPQQPPKEEWDIDYNYISITAKSYDEIYKRLAETTGALKLSTQDIHRMLRDLSNTTIRCDAYEPKWVDEKKEKILRLVRSKDKERCRARKVVDFGQDASELPTICISVAYLKEKLPNRLLDSLIQNLTLEEDNVTTLPPTITVTDGMMQLDPPKEPKENLLNLQHRLEGAMRIDPGDANETAVLRAIHDILECDVLGLTGQWTPEEEDECAATYGDVITGESPCETYVTSEHPLPLPASLVFGDLVSAGDGRRLKLPEEISMVDMPAAIRLRRKEDNPLVVYNHMTISPLAKASLSVYQQEHGMNSGGIEEEDGESTTGTLQSKRFMLHAEIATFRFDYDPDYTYCENHLKTMACPQKRTPNGRLINYPPHVYMNAVDWRDQQEKESGKRREFIPLYADVMHRIKTTRQMLNARRGQLSEAMPMSRFLAADCHEMDLTIRRPVQMQKRQACRSDSERTRDALKALESMNTLSVNQSDESWKQPQRTAKSTARSRKST